MTASFPAPPCPRHSHGFARNEAGGIAIISAALIGLIALLAMLVVDLGIVFLVKRNAQGVLDIAAQLSAQDVPRAEQIARRVLADNHLTSIAALVVTPGSYTRDADLPADRRFTAGASPQNAVRLALRTQADLAFAAFLYPGGKLNIDVTSVGAARRQAAFSIGSRLASVDGGILNAILGAMLGGGLSLTALDYNALATTHIRLFGFLDALASRIDVTAGSYDELLAADVSVGHLLGAAQASIPAGQSAMAIGKLADVASSNGKTLRLSRLIDLGQSGTNAIGADGAVLAADVSALSLISAIATVANGERQFTLSSGITLPDIAAVTIDIAVGERPAASPWLTLGDIGATVRTAQVRAALRIVVGGTGLLKGLSIKLPLVIEVAQAEAILTNIGCADRTRPTVDVAARPGIVNAWIADTNPFKLDRFATPGTINRAQILDVLGTVTVSGRAQVQIASINPQPLSYTWDEIASHVIKTASTADYAQSLVGGLISNLDLKPTVIGIPLLPLNGIVPAILGQLLPLTSTLDGALNAILGIAGVNLGQADIWVNGARCNLGLVG